MDSADYPRIVIDSPGGIGDRVSFQPEDSRESSSSVRAAPPEGLRRSGRFAPERYRPHEATVLHHGRKAVIEQFAVDVTPRY